MDRIQTGINLTCIDNSSDDLFLHFKDDIQSYLLNIDYGDEESRELLRAVEEKIEEAKESDS